VFATALDGSGFEIQRCDECWWGVADAPVDADYQEYLVCLAALERATLDGESRDAQVVVVVPAKP